MSLHRFTDTFVTARVRQIFEFRSRVLKQRFGVLPSHAYWH